MGQLCINLETQATCGFTALGGGNADANGNVQEPQLIGTKMYTPSVAFQKIFCFDLATSAPCAGQPYAFAVSGFPFASPHNGRIYGLALPSAGGAVSIWCFDTATSSCTGFPKVVATGNSTPAPSHEKVDRSAPARTRAEEAVRPAPLVDQSAVP